MARRLTSRIQCLKKEKDKWFSGSTARRLASRIEWLKNEKGKWFSGSAARQLASRIQWLNNEKGKWYSGSAARQSKNVFFFQENYGCDNHFEMMLMTLEISAIKLWVIVHTEVICLCFFIYLL